jgi:hypothetical protein
VIERRDDYAVMRDYLVEQFMEAVIDPLGIDRLGQPACSCKQNLSQLASGSHSALGHRLKVTEPSATAKAASYARLT